VGGERCADGAAVDQFQRVGEVALDAPAIGERVGALGVLPAHRRQSELLR